MLTILALLTPSHTAHTKKPSAPHHRAVIAPAHTSTVAATAAPRDTSAAVGRSVALSSTSYCQGTVTASGRAPFVGEVANNMWPLGTRISVSPPVWGRTRFVVLDRIGAYSQLDFYNSSCSAADEFGRRIEQVHVIR